ncbi:LuxR C-terminal-related transcriptional regulator [Kribbella sp. NBC_01245]|uniref:LuxR C-terminal-related transcriptional regulator n=1 Tax=Kribbella sp. NBC_01245 TaxID=2903578 RepID=UPI002E2953F4|nr:LuxR C-terminal-related transcriptional regulator [Kribbella sp. NBC_01245]
MVAETNGTLLAPREEPALPELDVGAVVIARAIAVLGADAPVWAVAELARMPVPDLLAGLDDLVARGLVANRFPLSLKSPEVRAALLAETPIGARIQAHLDAAHLLRGAGAGPEKVAEQLQQAGPAGVPWAAETLRAAAAQARGRGAPELATAYLRQALAERLDPAERAAVLSELAGIRAETDAPGAIAMLLDELPWAGTAEELQAIVGPLRRLLIAGGRHDEVPWMFDSAQERLAESDPVGAARLQLSRAAVQARLASGVASIEVTKGWLDERVKREPQLAVPLLALRASLATLTGADATKAVRSARAVLAEADPRVDFDLCWHALFALSVFGEPAAADAACLRVRRELAGHADEWDLVELDILRARAFRRKGDLRAAISLLSGLLPRLEGQVNRPLVASVVSSLAEAMVPAGAGESASALLQAHRSPDGHEPSPYGLLARGLVLSAGGQTAAAARDHLECGRQLTGWRADNPELIRWRPAAIGALLRLDRPADAVRLAEENYERAQACHSSAALGFAQYVLAGTRPLRERPVLLTEAVERSQAAGHLLDEAFAHYELGKALRSTSGEQSAHHHLLRAVTLAEECGARPLAERARALAGPSASAGRTRGLTPQEWKIAQLATDGRSNPEIAKELFLARRTVEFHLSGVYRKLAISGRRELTQLMRGRRP